MYHRPVHCIHWLIRLFLGCWTRYRYCVIRLLSWQSSIRGENLLSWPWLIMHESWITNCYHYHRDTEVLNILPDICSSEIMIHPTVYFSVRSIPKTSEYPLAYLKHDFSESVMPRLPENRDMYLMEHQTHGFVNPMKDKWSRLRPHLAV